MQTAQAADLLQLAQCRQRCQLCQCHQGINRLDKACCCIFQLQRAQVIQAELLSSPHDGCLSAPSSKNAAGALWAVLWGQFQGQELHIGLPSLLLDRTEQESKAKQRGSRRRLQREAVLREDAASTDPIQQCQAGRVTAGDHRSARHHLHARIRLLLCLQNGAGA